MRATQGGDVVGWLRDVHKICKSGSCPAPPFLKPFNFVTLAIALRQAGVVEKLNLPEKLQGYAARMRLWEAVGLESPGPTPNDLTGKGKGKGFKEVTPLLSDNEVDAVAVSLKDVVRESGALLTPEDEESVFIALVEIVGNCFSHSRSSGGLSGLACAQVWKNGSRAQIAIADPGIGVRASLAEDPSLAPLLLGSNACELATRYGVSSKLGQNHAGYGLTFARDLIRQNGGSFILVSGDEAFAEVAGRAESWAGLRYPIQGTLVVIEWVIENRLDAASVYASWPIAEDADELF